MAQMKALVVVGVDGSEGSKAALRFAVREAAVRAAKLRVVGAWQVPAAVYAGMWGMPGDQVSPFESQARDVAAQAVAEVKRLDPGLDCDSHVIDGQAAEVLLRESKDADLLVVGSRGLGGFRSLLLGSVGQQVVHHATVPVVIVPHPQASS